MHFPTFFGLILAAIDHTAAHSIPKTYVVHEQRDAHLDNPKRMHPDVMIPVRITLKQSNHAIENAHKWLMDVSHPSSDKYGQHWSQKDIVAAFQPSKESVEAVANWLADYGGISRYRQAITSSRSWVTFNATIEEVESLLATEYYRRDSANSALVHCNHYSLPDHVQEHVDFITPGVNGITVEYTTPQRIVQRDARQASRAKHTSSSLRQREEQSYLSHCDTDVSVECLQALYQFPAPDPCAKVNPNNSLGIFQDSFDVYSQADLDASFANFSSTIPNGTHPTLDSIDGVQPPASIKIQSGESDLDFEVVYPIIWPQTTTLYEVGDTQYRTKPFNIFLDALDSTYCDSTAFGETGDDPVLDPVFPNRDDSEGFQQPRMCGTYRPTNVISISYGISESNMTERYERRACQELLKLGLQGVTVVVASGDWGVADRPNPYRNGTCLKDGTVFDPIAPASCPWLTTVGGTMVTAGKTVYDEETAMYITRSRPYNIGTSTLSSGGGFSNMHPIPEYQASTIAAYFRDHEPPYPHYFFDGLTNASTGLYNRNGRGFPDVAAIGANIPIYVDGSWVRMGGTSASAPIFAALINRIVEERLKIGKGPLGFLNPVLYQHPYVLNDITNGTNPGCGTEGFSSVKGWDPVTGLGTPNYPKLLELALSLP